MTEKQFQPGTQHPGEWQHDLNPNLQAGQNNTNPERLGDSDDS